MDKPTQVAIRRHRVLLVMLLARIGHSMAQAQSVTITESPGAFSARSPTGWSRQPATGDARLKFVSPEGKPYAECAVLVKTRPSLRGRSQSDFDTAMRETPDAKAMARQLAKSYGDVRIISVANGALSGVPAQVYDVVYSVGTPARTEWVRSVTAIAVTVPDVIWTSTCGGQGRTLAEAQKAFDHWQIEFAKFSAFIEFLR
jgi:hypothetical protein